MKNYFGILIILILLFFIYREYKPGEESNASVITDSAASTQQSQTSDYSAGFAVFIHNSFQNFSDPGFYNRSEELFIQAPNPNIISVKKNGKKWGDFFRTLPITITKNCLTMRAGQNYCTGQGGELKFYVNGVKTEDIEEKLILPGDTLLITYGFESNEQISIQQKQLDGIVLP